MRRYRKLPRDVQHLLSRDPLDKIGAPRGNDMPHVRVGDDTAKWIALGLPTRGSQFFRAPYYSRVGELGPHKSTIVERVGLQAY
jgi:hypothetical protein